MLCVRLRVLNGWCFRVLRQVASRDHAGVVRLRQKSELGVTEPARQCAMLRCMGMGGKWRDLLGESATIACKLPSEVRAMPSRFLFQIRAPGWKAQGMFPEEARKVVIGG